MNNNHITDIFFDLDHTLYDFDKNSALTFQDIFRNLDLQVSEDFMTHFKPINDYYWEKLSRNEISHEYLRIARLKDTFQKIHVELSDQQITEIAERFMDNLVKYTHIFEGAHESLNYLKKKYRLHIITNGPDRVQWAKLQNTGLDIYFETLTNSELSGVKKPNPGIFTYALHAANVSAQNSIMIGDNWEADVQGARNVGMNVIWFNVSETSNSLEDVREIKHLLELQTLL